MSSEVSPFGLERARYFAERHAANQERRRRAAAAIRILESNLSLHLRQLDEERAATTSHDRGRERQLARHVDDIRSELHRQQRARWVRHADRLIEWAVDHGDRRLPEPGEFLLARRSKKPWRNEWKP